VKWFVVDKKVDGNGHPILSKKAALLIVRVFLPRVAPETKLKNFATMKSITEWLVELAGGTMGAVEIQALEDKNNNKKLPLQQLL
jgi:hypothetical protein